MIKNLYKRQKYWDDGYISYWKKRVAESKNQISKIIKDDPNTEDIDIYKKLFSKYRFNKGNILDIGCAWGRMFFLYEKYNLDIYGIDISKEMIKEAKKNYKNCKLFISASEKTKFKNNYFDNLCCIAVFDATYQTQTLNEIIRITKSEGLIFITGKNFNYLKSDIPAYKAEIGARKKKHPNFFTYTPKVIEYINTNHEMVDQYYFKKRGDFNKFKYVNKMPNKFYEYLIIFKKNSDQKIKHPISSKFSRLFKI